MAPTTLGDVRPGLASRARAARRRRLKLISLVVAVLLVAGAGVWLVGFSSVFALRTVQVNGATLTGADNVRAQAKAPTGTPLSRVDTSQLATRVAALPAVASVKVTKKWPNTIVIEVTERVAVVQRVASSGYQWIDAEGNAFHSTAAAKTGLVTVSVPEGDRRLYRDAATVAAALSPALKQQTSTLKVPSPDAISLALTKGRSVVWGSADQSALKSQVATALLSVKATVYDVSAPANPTSR